MCDYVNENRRDSQLRVLVLLKLYGEYVHLLYKTTQIKIKETLLGASYSYTNRPCASFDYFSESGQILFYVCEFLAGCMLPGETFERSGMTGTKLKSNGFEKCRKWVLLRLRHYLAFPYNAASLERITASLSLLIDFCENNSLVVMSAMLIDRILLSVSLHHFKGQFVAPSICASPAQIVSTNMCGVSQVASYLFGTLSRGEFDYSNICALFMLCKKYDFPEIIRIIGRWEGIRSTLCEKSGHDANRLLEQASGFEEAALMLTSMNITSDPDYIRIIDGFAKEKELYQREPFEFFHNFDLVRKSFAGKIFPLSWASRLQSARGDIPKKQRHIYTYKTSLYIMSTIQTAAAGKFYSNALYWIAALSPDLRIYTAHPRAPIDSYDDPSMYYVNFGITPYTAQYENINLSIFDLRFRKRKGEGERERYSYAYFPLNRFDEYLINSSYTKLLVRKDGVFACLISINPMELLKEDRETVRQTGDLTAWAVVLSSVYEMPSFADFKKYAETLNLSFSAGLLTLRTESSQFTLCYRGDFSKGGQRISTSYDAPRSDTADILVTEDELKLENSMKRLTHDYHTGERTVV